MAEVGYVILQDGLGRGGSSKPSDGLPPKFRTIGMANGRLPTRMVTEWRLGVFRAPGMVLGARMGGDADRIGRALYKDMMDVAVADGGQPVRMSGAGNWISQQGSRSRRSAPIRAIRRQLHHAADGRVVTAPAGRLNTANAPSAAARRRTAAGGQRFYRRMVDNARKQERTDALSRTRRCLGDYAAGGVAAKVKASFWQITRRRHGQPAGDRVDGRPAGVAIIPGRRVQ